MLEQTADVSSGNWAPAGTGVTVDLTNLQHSVSIPLNPGSAFYRLRGQ